MCHELGNMVDVYNRISHIALGATESRVCLVQSILLLNYEREAPEGWLIGTELGLHCRSMDL